MHRIETDCLVVGGGITGAGVALEAARSGLRVVLVEARDFAFGTSSRSSKLVHGGLRYLAQGDVALTREAVKERDTLMRELPGLVEPQRFLIAHYRRGGALRAPPRWQMHAGLALFDAFGGARTRAFPDAEEAMRLAPDLAADGLTGASTFLDSRVDDARLVMRVLREAERHGAKIFNRAAAIRFLRDSAGDVCGAAVAGEGLTAEVAAGAVVNAAGVWVDGLRAEIGASAKLRPLRGSHLVFPFWRLTVGHSISLFHPRDGRPVFATPWEGATLFGATDVDHEGDLADEPSISREEAEYLIEAARAAFPRLDLQLGDAIAAFAGVRPVVAGGAADPSKEKRDHVVLVENGLVSVTGGKLTTFRAMAREVMRALADRFPQIAKPSATSAMFEPAEPGPALRALAPPEARRLLGRYGRDAETLVAEAPDGALTSLAGTPFLAAELLWAARRESVRSLDDLLLRRTRLGLLARGGGLPAIEPWRPALCDGLSWSEARWRDERAAYQRLLASNYSAPPSRG